MKNPIIMGNWLVLACYYNLAKSELLVLLMVAYRGNTCPIKSTLEAIPIYTENLLKGIVENIIKVCFNYIMKRNNEYKGLHLATWKVITTLKD